MKSLLLYSSYDGQSKAIMTAIAAEMKDQIEYDLLDIDSVKEINLDNYQSVLIGASIRYGYFNKKVKAFAKRYQQALNQMPTAFFSVTLTARKLEKRTPETNAYTRKFLAATPWKPKDCEVFAGALHYPQYKWFDRVMIQLIMCMTGGETDTSKDIEYTDWQQVKEFAQRFIKLSMVKPAISVE